MTKEKQNIFVCMQRACVHRFFCVCHIFLPLLLFKYIYFVLFVIFQISHFVYLFCFYFCLFLLVYVVHMYVCIFAKYKQNIRATTTQTATTTTTAAADNRRISLLCANRSLITTRAELSITSH